MPAAEITTLFQQAGLDVVRVDSYRLDGEVEDLLSRSFPNDGDADRVREMFKDSLTTDAMDLAVHLSDGKIHYGFPVAIVAALKNSG
jgi:hypothetical protein